MYCEDQVLLFLDRLNLTHLHHKILAQEVSLCGALAGNLRVIADIVESHLLSIKSLHRQEAFTDIGKAKFERVLSRVGNDWDKACMIYVNDIFNNVFYPRSPRLRALLPDVGGPRIPNSNCPDS